MAALNPADKSMLLATLQAGKRTLDDIEAQINDLQAQTRGVVKEMVQAEVRLQSSPNVTPDEIREALA